MRDHERTKLCYVCQAVVQAQPAQWEEICQIGLGEEDPSETYREAIDTLHDALVFGGSIKSALRLLRLLNIKKKRRRMSVAQTVSHHLEWSFKEMARSEEDDVP